MSSGEVNKGRIDETDNMISEEGLNNSSARWVKECSVLIALAGQGKTRGTVAVNNISLTTNQSIAAIVLGETLHYEFVYQNLIMRYDELRLISSGDGTRGGLNKQIVSDVVVPYPSYDEQIKIGAFFAHLDHTIALHQRKLDRQRCLKKALLQLMFPQNGETEPQLSFANLSSAWEQRKLGDLVKLASGGTPSKENPKFWGGDIVWLSSQEIKQRYVSRGTYMITQKAVEETATKLVNKDTPLIVYRSGILAHTFPISRPTKTVAINQDIKALIFDHAQLNTQFVVSQLESKEQLILHKIVKTGTTVQSVNIPDLIRMYFFTTTMCEQTKIATFFDYLDNSIALHQTKLEKLQLLKKAYLQKMFI
jgi:type I restriction enzyme S subunit